MTFFLLSTILYIILLHWFADFVCQTHWQASNKSKNNTALLLHVSSYTAVLFLGMFFYYAYTGIDYTTEGPHLVIMLNAAALVAAFYALLNGTIHFITDFFTSRITAYLWKKGDIHNFFVVIGFDQVLHYTALFGSFFWFMSLGS